MREWARGATYADVGQTTTKHRVSSLDYGLGVRDMIFARRIERLPTRTSSSHQMRCTLARERCAKRPSHDELTRWVISSGLCVLNTSREPVTSRSVSGVVAWQ